MYARITTFHLKRDKHKEAINIYRESVIPEAKQQKGYIGAYFLSNRNAGKFMSITFWDNFENAVDNEKSGYYQKQVAKFDDAIVVTPEIDGYEVSAYDWPGE